MMEPGQDQSRRRRRMRGGSVIASAGIAAAVILVVALAGCGYWLIHTQRHSDRAARQQQVRAIAELLTRAGESMLETDQLSAVRGLVIEAARQYQLEAVRIVLPDGGVLADNHPGRITADLPPTNGAPPTDAAPPVESLDRDTFRLTRALTIPGRTTAQLEVTAPLRTDPQRVWEVQAGVSLIGGASLGVLLLGYRHFRGRLLAMATIREALLAMHGGESAAGALEVAPDLGDEASAWNRLLAEQHVLRRRAVMDEACQGLGGNATGIGGLAAGCDAMAQGLLLVDAQLHVKYANRAAALFLRTDHGAMRGRCVTDWVRHEQLVAILRGAAAGAAQRRAAVEVDREADESHGGGVLRFTAYPLDHGNKTAAMIVVEDVTQQRVAEKSRHEFVAQASHELRTPLTNIRLYVETAIDEGATDPELRANSLNVINQEAGRLERIVGDMLSVAEIDAGAMRIAHDDVRLDEVLRNIEADYRAAADSKNITLALGLPPKVPVVQGDREKLSTAAHNLVGNALKYTPDSGSVSVALEVGDRELTIEVSDTGIGIAPEDAARVFDKFYRAADKRIGGISGSGLGLALAREVVRLHGGDITLDSQLDQGSTFTVTLPLGSDGNHGE